MFIRGGEKGGGGMEVGAGGGGGGAEVAYIPIATLSPSVERTVRR